MRVLTYSHDSVGLGHLRRSVTMAGALVATGAPVEVLCLTGSPVPELFPLPERCDLVKLPSIGKDRDGRYVSRSLPVTIGAMTALRSDLITTTVRSFRPDLFLVDHTPMGPGGELLPVLRRLRHEGQRTRVVLGLRDVLDEPAAARRQLQRDDAFSLMRRCYDEVIVYGEREVFDPVGEYGFPADVAARTRFCGPVVAPEARALRPVVAPSTQRRPRRLLVTTGGGEDGYELLRSAVAALRGPLAGEAIDATLVAGPFLAAERYHAMQLAVEREPRIRLLRSSRDMQALRAGVDLVVGMGGYNTVYECLAGGMRLLAVPRTAPRREQLWRCQRLAARGVLAMLMAQDARDPHRLAAAIRHELAEAARTSRVALPCRGAEVAAAWLLHGRGLGDRAAVAADTAIQKAGS